MKVVAVIVVVFVVVPVAVGKWLKHNSKRYPPVDQ